MDIGILLLVYSFSFVFGMMVLTLIAQVGFMQKLFFRVLAGGSAGGLSTWYFLGIAPTITYLEYCLNGKLGVGGYFFLSSLVILVSVWGYNLNKTGRSVLR